MRLVLYSGGYLEENEELNDAVIEMIDSRKPRITYIPSAYENSDEYYEEFIAYFTTLGVKYFSVFHVDRPFTRQELRHALKSDAIYLSGGNTFYFLKHLRESGVIHSLNRFVRRGGILMGESAGSIIMTPTIATAAYPKWDRDDNEVELSDLRSLNLVNFDFFPHYENELRYQRELSYQSKLSRQPIYAVSDGSGIVVDDQKLTFIGGCYCYVQGHKFKIA